VFWVPILFPIYTGINELDYDMKSFILKFGDDTKVFGRALSTSFFLVTN